MPGRSRGHERETRPYATAPLRPSRHRVPPSTFLWACTSYPVPGCAPHLFLASPCPSVEGSRRGTHLSVRRLLAARPPIRRRSHRSSLSMCLTLWRTPQDQLPPPANREQHGHIRGRHPPTSAPSTAALAPTAHPPDGPPTCTPSRPRNSSCAFWYGSPCNTSPQPPPLCPVLALATMSPRSGHRPEMHPIRPPFPPPHCMLRPRVPWAPLVADVVC